MTDNMTQKDKEAEAQDELTRMAEAKVAAAHNAAAEEHKESANKQKDNSTS